MKRLRRTSRGWDDDFGTPRGAGGVDREGVIGCVGREARDVIRNTIDEIKSSLRVISACVSQSLGDNHARSINTQMKLLPATPAATSILGGGPFAFADDG